MIKVSFEHSDVCEIESIYFLKEYRGNGFGTKSLDFMKEHYNRSKITLWGLEINGKAYGFMKKTGLNLLGGSGLSAVEQYIIKNNMNIEIFLDKSSVFV